MVGVAQLVEHRVVVPGAAGSSPADPASRPHSSAAEHQDDNLERHVGLVLRVLRSCGEKDITLDYESRDWGFKSLRERAGSASSMREHLVHTQGTEVRFLR